MRSNILCGIGMLLAASAVQAHDGRVYVSGTITDNTCSLSPGSENINVSMGAVSQRQFYRVGDASGIGIALYDLNKTLIPLGQKSDVTTLSPGQASAHLQFYARYLADGGVVATGDANASATFILAYE
ncbi:fimbrial protein [Salmonella enterica]|nr:fimbrial protein [Salmonella enterica]